MSHLPLRARIAPIALVIVLGFVVVGFITADRAIVDAEEGRAKLVASHVAVAVDAFVATRMASVLSLREVVTREWQDVSSLPDSLARVRTLLRHKPGPVTFDAIVVLDSSGVARAGRTYVSGNDSLWLQEFGVQVTPGQFLAMSGMTLPSHAPGSDDSRRDAGGSARVLLRRAGPTEPVVLMFVSPMFSADRIAGYIVGLAPLDSLLRAIRHRQPELRGYRTVIGLGADTVLQFTRDVMRRPGREVRDSVISSGNQRWSVAVTYAPPSRGARIALWVIGLGALMGLAVGLVLERREARRIAERSSELEHLSTELLRANRAKSEFLANVSHELRTPLNAIVGFVDLLRDGVYGELNPRQVGPVERIEASANHLRHLVDQILDLAKIAAGRLEVHTEPIDLRPFIFDVASEVEPLITEKGLSLSLAVGATLPRVRTDPTHLRQIVVNLLGNAVKFTQSGGISVRGRLIGAGENGGRLTPTSLPSIVRVRPPRPDGLWIALQVGDSGVGLAEKDRERIFDEFEQVNAGPRGDSMRRGTGLGLSISRRLARLLGGDITVESELGRGSVFTVWIPVDAAELRDDRPE